MLEPLLVLKQNQLLLAQMLGHLLCRKLGFANLPEIFGQVKCLVLDQGGQESNIGRLAPSGGQIETYFLKLLPQLPAAVFALGSAQNAAQKGRVETLRRREAPLNLANSHLVLGR